MKIYFKQIGLTSLLLLISTNSFADDPPPPPPPPPPPGLPIGEDMYLLILTTIIFGFYVIYKHKIIKKSLS